MSQAVAKRTSLLVGCGSAALALGLLLGSAPTQAQGIQAGGNVTFGNATINQAVPGETRVRVTTRTTVIDWTPQEDAAGNALDFLPTNAFAYFENDSSASFVSNFAVLNRILPATNGNVAAINGSVISRIIQFNGSSAPGGFVAFYSPTGILVGGNAFFDVGQLMLTTLDTTPDSFDQFARNGFGLQLQGAQGSTARIRIQPGARIQALPENAFFAVVAADVEMRGIARVNGSHAYVAGEAVNLSLDNGLFTIQVPVGTAAAGEVMTLDGTIGGPSSQGIGDNHLIYAVARAARDPISMLFRGNLGFDPAQSAGVINGEIILAANYDVFGRNVDGASVRDGLNAEFRANSETSGVRADIDITDANVTGSTLAIGTHRVTAAAVGADSSFLGNLLLVGRESATLRTANGNDLTVNGDVLIDARDYGASGSFLQAIDVANAAAGAALIEATGGGTITVGGAANVRADAVAGADFGARSAGSARGGTAAISGDGGTVNIQGSALISARALGTTVPDLLTGAESRAGTAEARARAGGSVLVGQALIVEAGANAANGSLSSPSTVSNAFGGNARIAVNDGGGTIAIGAAAVLDASAASGSANEANLGSVADAGEATVSILETGNISVGSGVTMRARGLGGANAGGTGSIAFGGKALISTHNGGTINVVGDVFLEADGIGGAGLFGAPGFGGIVGVQARIGRISIDGKLTANANGAGGDATFGFGGRGGTGLAGISLVQAEGTLTQSASVRITDTAFLTASGFGGVGGASDGQAIAGGRGGDGLGNPGVPNPADPAFGRGAFVLAGGDNGTLDLANVLALSNGSGGVGGSAAGGLAGGQGGTGFGGVAQVGLALLGQNGSVGLGRASFGTIGISAAGIGGRSGRDVADMLDGFGGNGVGGLAKLTLHAGDLVADTIFIGASGSGGDGGIAGRGTGGSAVVDGSLGGTIVSTSLLADARGFGGFSSFIATTGGIGTGGAARVEVNGTTITTNSGLLLYASGQGGGSATGAGGDGRGGTAFIGQVGSGAAGVLNVLGGAALFANGQGGDSNGIDGSPSGGNGFGGTAQILSAAGSRTTFGFVQLTAMGVGGTSVAHEGGDGTGGLVEMIARGAGSRITIARNVPDTFALFSPGGAAILNAEGIGQNTRGGDGIGGAGRGGTVQLVASLGGTLNLPVNILSDPQRAADSLFMTARGTGGDSGVDGGTGGVGAGGAVNMLVDGGTLIAGAATLIAFAQGGNSADPALNVTGGSATGGARTIRVVNGGTLTLDATGGGAGAQGGNGSGTGNGGNATGGNVLFEVLGSTANLAGTFGLFNTATGGTGQRGGNANGGTITVNAANSTIALSTSPTAGPAFMVLDSAMTGGEGAVAGGDATGNTVNVTLNTTSLTGGTLSVVQTTAGGRATTANGTGGNATGRAVQVTADGSTLSLVGPLTVSASARGGDGGANAAGGTAQGGGATLSLTNTGLTLAAGAQGAPANIAVRADGDGGLGGTVGDGRGGAASFAANGGSVTTGQLLVSAQGGALGLQGQTGGAAAGGLASLKLGGSATLGASTITLTSSAGTGFGGTSRGGIARFDVDPGANVTVNAATLQMFGDATGVDPAALAYRSGAFIINIGGGNVNLGRLDATAIGNRLSLDPVASQIVAIGGSLNVTGQLTGIAFGDITLSYGSNGIIGTATPAQATTAIRIDTRGTLRVTGIVPGTPPNQVTSGTFGGGLQSFNGATGGIGGRNVAFNAGRSIVIDGRINASNVVSLVANTGSGQPLAQPAASVISMTSGSSINAGGGLVAISLDDGGSDPQRQTGAITLANITAREIQVNQRGSSAGSDIVILSDGVLTASGTGRAIDLASFNGEVINNHGDPGLILTGGGHYGIWAATPTGSRIGSFANYVRRYNVQTELAYDALNPGGNFAAFRITPVLTVTADNATRFYGSANPAFTASFAGFQPGDSVADLTGALQFLTGANGTSPVGQYALNVAQGTLVSPQGYQFTFAPGILNITPRPITITASNFSRIYGNANPALTFAIGGQGLVNGDQLTGALATTAGLTSGVGSYAITQGTLAASNNYAVTFVGGQLTVTPRPITITAESFSRIYGNANPALTFTLGGLGLVNGDQLTGALATTAGVTTGVGTTAITQGTLAASANYAVTFNPGVLTITPRPLSITAASLSRVYGNANPALTFTLGGLGLVNGDQLTGALAAAGVTAGVGTSPITIGTLTAGANYAVTFTPGVLTITPRPLTVAANNLSKTLGLVDPLLTFLITSGDLVNGDQLSGSLVRDPGETIASFVIRQGTLTAGANYAITFVPGTFTINPPPVSPDLYNPTTFAPALIIGDTLPPVVGEVQDRFGIEFPERPEEALISEDPLLDDPVASGGDTSVYGGAAAPAGDK